MDIWDFWLSLAYDAFGTVNARYCFQSIWSHKPCDIFHSGILYSEIPSPQARLNVVAGAYHI